MIHELIINEWSGAHLGVWLEEMPAIPTARERGERRTMPGMDGSIWLSDGGRENVDITLSLYVDAGQDIEAVREWVMGAQKVRISPFTWEWRVDTHESAPEFTEWLIPGEGWEVEVTFKAEPYRYVIGNRLDRTLNGNGTFTINNPYNADALPNIWVAFTAETETKCTVTINDTIVEITPRTRRNHYINSANHSMNDPQYQVLKGADGVRPTWPVLKPGDNRIVVSGANVSKTVLTANWRLR